MASTTVEISCEVEGYLACVETVCQYIDSPGDHALKRRLANLIRAKASDDPDVAWQCTVEMNGLTAVVVPSKLLTALTDAIRSGKVAKFLEVRA